MEIGWGSGTVCSAGVALEEVALPRSGPLASDRNTGSASFQVFLTPTPWEPPSIPLQSWQRPPPTPALQAPTVVHCNFLQVPSVLVTLTQLGHAWSSKPTLAGVSLRTEPWFWRLLILCSEGGGLWPRLSLNAGQLFGVPYIPSREKPQTPFYFIWISLIIYIYFIWISIIVWISIQIRF